MKVSNPLYYVLQAYRVLHRLLARQSPWREPPKHENTGPAESSPNNEEQAAADQNIPLTTPTAVSDQEDYVKDLERLQKDSSLGESKEWSPDGNHENLEADIRRAMEIFHGLRSHLKREVSTRSYSPRMEGEATLPPLMERIVTLNEILNMEKPKPKTAGNYVVCYDISDNRVRTRLAHYLEEKGFQRMQKSVFIGQIERATIRTVKNTLISISEVFVPTDSIVVVPLNEADLRKMNVVGRKINLAYALGRSHTLYI
ncbi:MAG: CRISPR-associated endonuclease Cas2 [Saprospiraceae bacterium]|nr:CRISPR-associated endonuclease Cas2 [Saprospiraceae bacterium]